MYGKALKMNKNSESSDSDSLPVKSVKRSGKPHVEQKQEPDMPPQTLTL
jgi:hypothetical protein